MSTRAIVTFKAPAEELETSIYVHGDGDPQSLGIDLHWALARTHIINGIPTDMDDIFGKFANGAGDLFLQTIMQLKGETVGYIYLCNPHNNSFVDYHYEVLIDDEDEITISCREAEIENETLDEFKTIIQGFSHV